MGDPEVIVPLSQHPEHVRTVAEWIHEEWGETSICEVEEGFKEREGCPGALVALVDDAPGGVLMFKRFPERGGAQTDLWVNALYVEKSVRGRGLGGRLVKEAMLVAQRLGEAELFVYTDIPGFYERLGWARERVAEEVGMHVLKCALQE